MSERKVDLIWVMFGFGVSYILFGLTLIIEIYPVNTKMIMGLISTICGFVFMIFGVIRFRPKNKK